MFSVKLAGFAVVGVDFVQKFFCFDFKVSYIVYIVLILFVHLFSEHFCCFSLLNIDIFELVVFKHVFCGVSEGTFELFYPGNNAV